MDLKSADSSPAFPIVPYNSLAYLINHINIATTRKKPKIKILITRKTLPLLQALHRVGCVNRYVHLHKYQKQLKLSYVFLTIPFFKQKPFFKSIRLVSTSAKSYNISLIAIRCIADSLRSSLLLLSTPYGIIDHREAIRLKTGGLLLCVIH